MIVPNKLFSRVCFPVSLSSLDPPIDDSLHVYMEPKAVRVVWRGGIDPNLGLNPCFLHKPKSPTLRPLYNVRAHTAIICNALLGFVIITRKPSPLSKRFLLSFLGTVEGNARDTSLNRRKILNHHH